MSKTYYVDEAMLGSDWLGCCGALGEFVDLLNEELADDGIDIVAVAVTDSYNGVDNRGDICVATDAAWERALDRTPAAWWR